MDSALKQALSEYSSKQIKEIEARAKEIREGRIPKNQPRTKEKYYGKKLYICTNEFPYSKKYRSYSKDNDCTSLNYWVHDDCLLQRLEMCYGWISHYVCRNCGLTFREMPDQTGYAQHNTGKKVERAKYFTCE